MRQVIEHVSFEDFQLELIDEVGNLVSTTQPIDVDSFEDGDLRYCKKVQMSDLGPDLQECYEKFHFPVLNFAKNVISKDSNWN